MAASGFLPTASWREAFHGGFTGGAVKSADWMLGSGSPSVNPTIVVEAGWYESYAKLLSDVRLWLEGTNESENGAVMVAIVVKLTRHESAAALPSDGKDYDESTMHTTYFDTVDADMIKGFLEVYQRDENGLMQRNGDRIVGIPRNQDVFRG